MAWAYSKPDFWLGKVGFFVNFYSHIAIASLYSEDVRLALGAMLPDLASLVGTKPPKSNCPDISHGYALHHATDRSFHALEGFRRAEFAESRTLQLLGFSRGTAWAAAHVGLELLFDDALALDEPTQALFRAAIAAAAPQLLGQSLEWGSDAQAAQFETLRQRVWTLAKDRPPLDPMTLSERLCRTLAPRPKLAVRAGDRALLHRWAVGLEMRSSSLWPEVVASVVSDLEAWNWHPSPALARPLRFRRASDWEV